MSRGSSTSRLWQGGAIAENEFSWESLTELRQMLLTNIDKFEAEARRRGRVEGQVDSAKALLDWKFGQDGLAMHALIDSEESAERLNELIRLVAQGRDLPSIRRELWP